MVKKHQSELKKKQSVLTEAVHLTWHQFALETSIHGIKFLIDPQGNFFTKLIWIMMILGGFIASNLLVETFWLRYKSNPTRLSVVTKHEPITRLRLPGITICPVDRIDIKRAYSFINTLQIPKNVTKEMLLDYLALSAGFLDNISYQKEDLIMIQDILNLNRIETEQAMSLLSRTCEDLLSKCRWKFKESQCNRLFTTSYTYRGTCCTFNLKSDFESTPYFTYGGGLSIAIAPQIIKGTFSSTFSEGVKLLIHERNVFPSDLSIEKMIPHHYETTIRISSEATVCSPEVQSLSKTDRECLFYDERQLRFFNKYKENNCDVECRMLKILHFCQCLPYYFKTEESISVCNFTKIQCLVDNYLPIHEAGLDPFLLCSNCPSNCDKFSFEARTSETLFIPSNFTADAFYDGLNSSYLVLHISFGSQVFAIMRRDLLTSIISLAASLGGVYSLFIGMGALTFFEVLYFCTIRFHDNFNKIKARHLKTTSVSKKAMKSHPTKDL